MKNGKKLLIALAIFAVTGLFTQCTESNSKTSVKADLGDSTKNSQDSSDEEINESSNSDYKPIDTALYNKKLKELANGDTTGKWPVKNQPYPLPGAILPFKRVVTYYGNL